MDAAKLQDYLKAMQDADGHTGDLAAGLLAHLQKSIEQTDEASCQEEEKEEGEDMEEEEAVHDPVLEDGEAGEGENEEVEPEEEEEEADEDEENEEAGDEEEEEAAEEEEEETFTMLPYGEIPESMEGWFEQEGVASVQYEVGRAQTHESFPHFVKQAREAEGQEVDLWQEEPSGRSRRLVGVP